MNVLLLISFAGLFAVVWTIRCNPSDNDGDLHCGDYVNMTCNDIHFIPYCHALRNSKEGVCTCEKACVDQSECTGGCYSSRYSLVCVETYTGAVEKICRCQRKS